MSDDRFRKHMRVPLPMVVEVKFDGDEDFQPHLMIDLSWGGMYLRTEETRPVGTTCLTQLPSPEGGGVLEIEGKVVTQDKTADGRTTPGVGVAFDELDQSAKSIIQKLIDRMLSPSSQ